MIEGILSRSAFDSGNLIADGALNFPTAREERLPLLSQKDATAEEVCTADEIKYLDVTPADRADIVCRVFEQKVKAFVNFLKEVQTFSYVIAVLYTIEFQQRGLPHCHTLLWVNSKDKIKDAEQIDEYISAEIPDPVEDPKGHKLVTKLMMHGPCCGANLSASCMQNILNVHLENLQCVNFRERDKLDVIVNLPDKKKRLLPNGELFYFWMLLCHQKECSSPVEVRTVNGQVLPTYRATCEALGLLGDDKEWDIALEESAISATSAEIRTLFAQILIYCDVADLKKLWTKHWEAMRDDIPSNIEWRRTKVFAKWVLDVGNGEIGEPDEEGIQDNYWITIPPEYFLTYDETGMSELIDFIYDEATLKTPTVGTLQEKAIVCPKNDTIDDVNAKILFSIGWSSKIYLSNDEAILIGKESEFPEHHFECVAYNQLALRVPYKDGNSKMIYPLLIGYVRYIGEETPFGDSKIEQKYLRKLDIENIE
nr:DNA helicase [Tanacetum cinerariifolium]